MYIYCPLSLHLSTKKALLFSLRHSEGAVGFRSTTRGKKTQVTKTGDSSLDHVISDSPIMFGGLKKK